MTAARSAKPKITKGGSGINIIVKIAPTLNSEPKRTRKIVLEREKMAGYVLYKSQHKIPTSIVTVRESIKARPIAPKVETETIESNKNNPTLTAVALSGEIASCLA